jgi:hypothetical protein
MFGLFESVSPMSDIDQGRAAVVEFHNYATAHYAQNYKFSLAQMLDELNRQNKFLLEGLGLTIRTTEMTPPKVSSAMRALVDKGEGRLPANWNSWFTALKDENLNVSFVDAISYTAAQSAADVVHGAQAVGDAVIDTGKSLLVIGPLLAVAAIVFIGYSRTRQVAGA